MASGFGALSHSNPLSPVKLREAQFDDHARIAPLARKYNLQTESYEQWSHLWKDNPAYKEVNGRMPIGWVLETSRGEIAGYLGNIPLRYEFEGKPLVVATTRAWVAEVAYRGFSTLLLATYFKQPNVDLFLNTSLNSQAASAYSSFETIRVPVGAWDRALFWITNYEGFSASLLRRRNWTAAAPAIHALSAGLFVWDRLRRTRFTVQRNALNVVLCSGFDERFDQFWEALRYKKSALLLGTRNREALSWHFKFAISQNAAWIYVLETKDSILAYSVFLRQDSQEAGLTRVRLADFQCLEPERAPEILRAMVEMAIARCRAESLHMLELVGLAPAFEKDLERLLPLRRQLPNWPYFYKANYSALAEKLNSAAVWEPSIYDGDSSL